MTLATTLGAAMSFLAAPSAPALDNARQILAAGNGQGENTTQWAGPGMSNVYSSNYPGTGQGEAAASIRMPAGTLSNLRVNVVTQNVPISGTFRVRLRINGANTNLTCTTTGTATCDKLSSVAVADNDKVVLQVSNTFSGATVIAWTATLEYD